MISERFSSLPFGAQTIGGLLGERMRVNLDRRLLPVDEAKLTACFLARTAVGSDAAAWAGEHAGKFLDAACQVLRYESNDELREIVDRVARALIASQSHDGYLGTYPGADRWTGWDVWVHKYCLIGLLSYYEFTADAAALNAGQKIGALLVDTFGDGPAQRCIAASGDHMGMAAMSVLEPMVDLYRLTTDQRFLQFCHYIVQAYDAPQGPKIISSLLAHGDVYRTANAKAYEMLSNLNGILDLYRVTGEGTLLAAVGRGWQDVVDNQLFVTGSASALECFQPRGRLLSLASSNVGEMCVTTTWLQLTYRLLKLTGDPRFAQEIERTVYNHLLASQDARSGDISYYTPLVGHKLHTHEMLCCVSSGPRAISLIPGLIWGIDGDAFAIHQYTAGEANFEIAGCRAQLVSDTRFPLEGAVALALTLDRPGTFTLRLRIPEWATRFTVVIAETTYSGMPGTMLEIRRQWHHANHIQIAMALELQILSGSTAYPDFVALKYGPCVLALEASLNRGLPYLARVEASAGDPRLRLSRSSEIWDGPVYEIEAIVGTPTAAGMLQREVRTVRFVPIADAADYRVWLWAPERMPLTIPPLTALTYAGTSTWHADMSPRGHGYVARNIAEYINDEQSRAACEVDPRNLALAAYTPAALGKRGDAVWFAAVIEAGQPFRRVLFRHGPTSEQGGWFDTSSGKPYVEISREPVPELRFPEWRKVKWERIATFDDYPDTDGTTPPSAAAETIEVRFMKPVQGHAIRIVGRPAGDYVSCAELSAYA
jgi:uncharacterized protein